MSNSTNTGRYADRVEAVRFVTASILALGGELLLFGDLQFSVTQFALTLLIFWTTYTVWGLAQNSIGN